MTDVVNLDPWEYQWASHVGISRFTANWTKENAAYYVPEAMEDDRTAQVAAAITELAVAKHTNRYWSGSHWSKADHAKYRHLPDVGRNIEVRRVRTRDATVRYKQVGLGLVLFVGHPIPKEFRQVEIWGWLPYDEAWEYGIQPQDDRSGVNRLVPRDSLRTDLP